ncbi:FimV/HubP family polar landmark protein [Duganella guangzhouensis]|uniref:FimV/HubP family polar landmark protein n=1 Tax=Duganella guangzhouensis TaxID=2666084 RepID=UPI001E3C9756|nr:FimV/HubP family polar landmark protein [Duganella guangzhouensis]
MKTLTSAVASAVLVAATANAAGLGKLTVLSSLGQPLRAEIELTSVSADEAGALVAKLAPAEAFRAANIDFNPALMSLRFEVEPRNGKQVIKVSSSQAINEPFVDMLLELNWNGGRMVREYTFLLDPPDLRATQAPQVTAPVDLGNRLPAQAPAAAPQQQAAANVAPAAAAVPAAPAARPPAPAVPVKQAGSQYTVKAGDNLTRIANQVKPTDVSLDLMLVALYRANPEAFAGNNMNRLKSGQILAVPDSDAIRAVGSDGDARGVVVAHAADFNAYRAKLAGQVAAAAPAKEADASQNVSGKITAKVEEKPNATNTAKDKLTLSKATTAAPQQGKTGQAVEEDKLAKQKQVEEAAARVKELEKNVNDLEKLMALKSKSGAEAKASVPDLTAAAGASASASVPAEPKPKRTLVLPPKRLAEPSLFETLMDNITYVGIAGAAVLAGALGIVASRRRKKFVVPQEEVSILGDTALPPAQPLIADAGGQSIDTNNSVFNSNFAPSASQLDTNEVDPVAEADVYIAYGRDAQAEEILKEALRTHPERHAVRLKLLEIYATRKDLRAFETQASELYALTRGQGAEWEHAAALGKALDPANPLYSAGHDGGLAAPAALAAGAAAAAVAATPDFGSDFGATYTPAEAEAAPAALDLDLSQDAAPAPAPASTVDPLDFGAELDAGLPPAADASVSPASVAAEADNLMDFDLSGLNFEPVSTTAPAAEAPAPAPVDDLSMDFGLDLPTAPAPAPAPAADAPAPLDDLSLDFDLEPPAAPAPAAEAPAPTLPSADTDPLDLDLDGFDIPEVPALAEPPKAAAPLDFDTSFDLPGEIETITPAPAPAAPEFDLSSIDLDLDHALDGGSATATETAPVSAPTQASNEPLSAHHMEMDTKLDLAVAYQEIGDKEGARELLDEVLRGGSDEQVAKANAMKAQLG